VRRARRAAPCARTGAISAHGPLAGRLGSGSRLALGRHRRSEESEPQRPDRVLPKGVVSAPGWRRPDFTPAEDSQSWNCFLGAGGRQLSVGLDTGCGTRAVRRGPYGRFHVEHRQPIKLASVTGTGVVNPAPITTQTRQVACARARGCDPKPLAFQEPERTGRTDRGVQRPQEHPGKHRPD
jgi:hypothetical protein